MSANNLWNENRDLWNDNQSLRAANDNLVRANSLLREDLDEEKRKAYDCHMRFTNRCKVIEGLEEENRALKHEKSQESKRLSEMLNAQATENRRLILDNQRLHAEKEELKDAKASEVELKQAEINQLKTKLVKFDTYTKELKKAKDTAYVKMAEAEHKQLDAQGELKRVKIELAELHKGAKESAEVKQAMSERLKSFSAQNKGLLQEVLELKKKRPLEEAVPSPQAKVVVVAEPINQGALMKAKAELETKNAGLIAENEVLKAYNGELEERIAKIHSLSRA
jgi:hypothetical protein